MLVGLGLTAILAGCRHGQSDAAGTDVHRAIPGAPAGTPAWLTQLAWSTANGPGDPSPEHISFRLGVPGRNVRVFDTVALRGDFSCETCHGPTGSAAQLHGRFARIVVNARTRRTLSFSLNG